MRDFRAVWYDRSATAVGCWRVSVKGGQMFLHERTDDGWEDRALDERAADLMRAARASAAPSALVHSVEVDGWLCDFTWVDAGQPFRETWWQRNSVGEPVRRRAEDVPLAVKCAILAEFSAQ